MVAATLATFAVVETTVAMAAWTVSSAGVVMVLAATAAQYKSSFLYKKLNPIELNRKKYKIGDLSSSTRPTT